VDRRAGLAVGGLALAGALAIRVVRRRRAPVPEPAPDPRAEELRRRLEESRVLIGEREEFEAAETPVDVAEPVAPPEPELENVDEVRRETHERGRSVVDEMRRSTGDGD
jgi:hypothetical protein